MRQYWVQLRWFGKKKNHEQLRFMKSFFLIALFGIALNSFSQSNIFPVIPQPNSFQLSEGYFVLDENVHLIDPDETFENEISVFNSMMKKTFGLKFQSYPAEMDQSKNLQSIQFDFLENVSAEGYYKLEVTKDFIHITGDRAGVMYTLNLKSLCLRTCSGRTFCG